MGIAAISGGFQPLNASLQTAKVAQATAVQSGDGDGDSDDHGGVSTTSDRLLDMKA
jgi:hypothetical protein